jgi:hypothetical protein
MTPSGIEPANMQFWHSALTNCATALTLVVTIKTIRETETKHQSLAPATVCDVPSPCSIFHKNRVYYLEGIYVYIYPMHITLLQLIRYTLQMALVSLQTHKFQRLPFRCY